MTLQSVKLDLRSGAGHPVLPAPGGGAPRIGPNSILQTFRALEELEPGTVTAVRQRCGTIPWPLPPGMVPEGYFLELVKGVRACLPSPRAEAVLRRSGVYTALYVAQHRIPRPVRAILSLSWPSLGLAMLLPAFRAHAWTFAGGGHFSFHGHTITLHDCPTCRSGTGLGEGVKGGAYYEAAFEGLLSLAAPRVRVVETRCAATGPGPCTFDVFPAGGPPCASS